MLFWRLNSSTRCVCKRRELTQRDVKLAVYREKDVFERRSAANDAKKALLEKFKNRPSADHPDVIARQEERKRVLEAREKREAEREELRRERMAREAEERAKREAEEAEARRVAEEKARIEAELRAQEEAERAALDLADEAARKAKRDARYAARKARAGRH